MKSPSTGTQGFTWVCPTFASLQIEYVKYYLMYDRLHGVLPVGQSVLQVGCMYRTL